MKKNLERQRQLRDQKRARLEKLMADVQALEQISLAPLLEHIERVGVVIYPEP